MSNYEFAIKAMLQFAAEREAEVRAGAIMECVKVCREMAKDAYRIMGCTECAEAIERLSTKARGGE